MNYYSGKTGNDEKLTLAPLSDMQAMAVGPEYEGAAGYFLYRTFHSDPQKIEVLAHVDSDEAAFQVSLLLGLE